MVRCRVLYVVSVLLVGHVVASAQIEGKTVLKRTGREPELVDSASFKRSSREYRVWKGKANFLLSASEVEYCRPPKPEGFDQIADAERLAALVHKHYGLWWDIEAFKKLMPLYVATGKNQEAIRLYREMREAPGPSAPLSCTRNYWDALEQDGQKATLRRAIAETIANGNREASAWAYLMRGDLHRSEGTSEKALLEGYLRTVMIFDDITSCRRDALRKTAETMERLGDSRSDKFRRLLRDEFPE